jgi:hypothetical protein
MKRIHFLEISDEPWCPPDQVRYGVEHYQQHSADTSTLLGQLFEGYEREGFTMPYTMEDFRRDYVKEHLKDLTLQERLAGLSPEERLDGLSPNEIERYLRLRNRRRHQSARKRSSP